MQQRTLDGGPIAATLFVVCILAIWYFFFGGFVQADPNWRHDYFAGVAPVDDPDLPAETTKAGFNEATFKIPFAVTHCNLITGSYGEPIRTDCYRKVVWNYQAEGTVKEIVTTLSASRFTRQYDAQVNAATVEYIVRGPAMSQALISENPNNVLCNPKYSVTGILHMNIEDDPDDYSFARDQGPPTPEQ